MEIVDGERRTFVAMFFSYEIWRFYVFMNF